MARRKKEVIKAETGTGNIKPEDKKEEVATSIELPEVVVTPEKKEEKTTTEEPAKPVSNYRKFNIEGYGDVDIDDEFLKRVGGFETSNKRELQEIIDGIKNGSITGITAAGLLTGNLSKKLMKNTTAARLFGINNGSVRAQNTGSAFSDYMRKGQEEIAAAKRDEELKAIAEAKAKEEAEKNAAQKAEEIDTTVRNTTATPIDAQQIADVAKDANSGIDESINEQIIADRLADLTKQYNDQGRYLIDGEDAENPYNWVYRDAEGNDVNGLYNEFNQYNSPLYDMLGLDNLKYYHNGRTEDFYSTPELQASEAYKQFKEGRDAAMESYKNRYYSGDYVSDVDQHKTQRHDALKAAGIEDSDWAVIGDALEFNNKYGDFIISQNTPNGVKLFRFENGKLNPVSAKVNDLGQVIINGKNYGVFNEGAKAHKDLKNINKGWGPFDWGRGVQYKRKGGAVNFAKVKKLQKGRKVSSSDATAESVNTEMEKTRQQNESKRTATMGEVVDNAYSMTGTDKAKLAALVADIGALGVSFVPGAGNAIAAGVGAGATTANMGAEFADRERTGRSVGSILGDAAIGYGLDLATALPGIGSMAKASKTMKAVKTAYKPLKALLVANGLSGGLAALEKIMSDKEVTIDDWRALAQGLQAGITGSQSVAKRLATKSAPKKFTLGSSDAMGNKKNLEFASKEAAQNYYKDHADIKALEKANAAKGTNITDADKNLLNDKIAAFNKKYTTAQYDAGTTLDSSTRLGANPFKKGADGSRGHLTTKTAKVGTEGGGMFNRKPVTAGEAGNNVVQNAAAKWMNMTTSGRWNKMYGNQAAPAAATTAATTTATATSANNTTATPSPAPAAPASTSTPNTSAAAPVTPAPSATPTPASASSTTPGTPTPAPTPAPAAAPTVSPAPAAQPTPAPAKATYATRAERAEKAKASMPSEKSASSLASRKLLNQSKANSLRTLEEAKKARTVANAASTSTTAANQKAATQAAAEANKPKALPAHNKKTPKPKTSNTSHGNIPAEAGKKKTSAKSFEGDTRERRDAQINLPKRQNKESVYAILNKYNFSGSNKAKAKTSAIDDVNKSKEMSAATKKKVVAYINKLQKGGLVRKFSTGGSSQFDGGGITSIFDKINGKSLLSGENLALGMNLLANKKMADLDKKAPKLQNTAPINYNRYSSVGLSSIMPQVNNINANVNSVQPQYTDAKLNAAVNLGMNANANDAINSAYNGLNTTNNAIDQQNVQLSNNEKQTNNAIAAQNAKNTYDWQNTRHQNKMTRLRSDFGSFVNRINENTLQQRQNEAKRKALDLQIDSIPLQNEYMDKSTAFSDKWANKAKAAGFTDLTEYLMANPEAEKLYTREKLAMNNALTTKKLELQKLYLKSGGKMTLAEKKELAAYNAEMKAKAESIKQYNNLIKERAQSQEKMLNFMAKQLQKTTR